MSKAILELAERRADLAVATAKRNVARERLIAEILRRIAEDPTATNVALAGEFGYASETSIRKIRDSILGNGDKP